jgi:predicted metal-dependent hydrolase
MTEPPITSPPIDIVRSTRRKKTVQAVIADGRIKVMVPARMPEDEVQRVAFQMSQKLLRKRSSHEVDLASRARSLARRFDLPVPESIEWSARQNTRWGSCTPSLQTIRISDRLAAMPAWVLDYVIVHELAHLVVDGHGPTFDTIVDRYPLAERARGYLMAKSEHA